MWSVVYEPNNDGGELGKRESRHRNVDSFDKISVKVRVR
jgi:hypothetical protein